MSNFIFVSVNIAGLQKTTMEQAQHQFVLNYATGKVISRNSRRCKELLKSGCRLFLNEEDPSIPILRSWKNEGKIEALYDSRREIHKRFITKQKKPLISLELPVEDANADPEA